METIERAHHNSEAYWQAVALRRQVLRLPLGMDFSDDELADEHSQWHFVAHDGAQLIGTLSALPIDTQRIKFRQMAVHPDFQRRGIGQRLMQKAHLHAAQAGYVQALLHARIAAAGFYETLGYERYGTPFTEIGLPHIAMQRLLQR